jgi:hypothetical protein
MLSRMVGASAVPNSPRPSCVVVKCGDNVTAYYADVCCISITYFDAALSRISTENSAYRLRSLGAGADANLAALRPLWRRTNFPPALHDAMKVRQLPSAPGR